MKICKYRVSENNTDFGETCMLRPHLGAKKVTRHKFPYLLSSTLFLKVVSLTSVLCRSMLEFAWRNFIFLNVEPLKRQDPSKFHYVSYRDVMKHYVTLSSSFSRSKSFIKNPLCTCWTTAIDLTGDVLAIPTRSITTEISHQI